LEVLNEKKNEKKTTGTETQLKGGIRLSRELAGKVGEGTKEKWTRKKKGE